MGGIEIRNNGQQDATNVEVKILLNNESKASVTVDKIDKQSAKTLDLKYDLPSNTGSYMIKVQVNPDHKVGESRYDNNEVSVNYKLI